MKHRLFLSLDLPLALRPSVLELQKQLDALKLPVTWTPAEKLHLTLNFLGKVEGDLIPQILKKVGSVCKDTPVFNLQPYFLETLYSRHDPSIIYLLPIGDTETLKQFQKQISRQLSDLRLSQPQRFLPHFTIGKLDRTDPVATKKYLDSVSEFEFSPLPSFPVEKVTLYQSLVYKDGSNYQKLHDLYLI